MLTEQRHEEQQEEQQEQQLEVPTTELIAAREVSRPKVLLAWPNLAAYVLNLGITYVSITGAFGATNSDLSAKYQTLVTPAGWAFSIWGLIFVGEFLSVVAQFLPRYRSHPVVQPSTPWWLAACAFQICWTFAFAQEVIWLSVVFMLGLLGSLVGMALSADSVPLTLEEYWVLRAPFALHLGWIVCASAVNINVLADASKAEPATLLGMAILSFAAVLLIATLFAVLVRRPEPFLGLVAAWALAAINSELTDAESLNSPSRYNPYAWDGVTLSALRFAAVGLAVAAGALAALAVALRCASARRGAARSQE